jgi:hypothetical protein
MPVILNAVTYQGYLVEAMQLKRSPGLEPDFGFVDIPFSEFKQLKINNPNLVPWIDNGIPGGSTPEGLASSRRTVAIRPPVNIPDPQQGFNPVGTLYLESELPLRTIEHDILDIYIAPGGMEEISRDLDNAGKHNEGMWRVPITDVRIWWKYGALAKSFNVRLDGGQFDPDTIKADGSPYAMLEVLEFLLSQLPGGVTIDAASRVRGLRLSPPENVIGEMNPVVEVFRQLLDRYALELSLTDVRTVDIYRKFEPVPHRTYFAQFPNLKQEISFKHLLSYERKSVTLSDRPPLVAVVGKRRIREMEVPYIPIYQDTDGKFYPLSELGNRWGYSIEELKQVVFVGHEKAFRNVPGKLRPEQFQKLLPRQFARGDGARYFERIRILQKWAFKGYGPAHMFTGRTEDSGGIGITEKEIQRLPFLPMHEFMERTDDTLSGIRLVQPQVYGYTIRQAFFTGRERYEPGKTEGRTLKGELAVIKRVLDPKTGKPVSKKVLQRIQGGEQIPPQGEGVFDDPVVKEPRKVPAFKELEEAVREHIDRMVQDTTDRELAYDELAKIAADASSTLLALNIEGQGVQLGEDSEGRRILPKKLNTDLSGIGYFFPVQIQVRPEDEAKANSAFIRLRNSISQINKDLDDIAAAKAKEEALFKEITKVYDTFGGLAGWINHPRAYISQGEYNLDRETGIILFNDVVGVMSEPFCIDRESVEIETDGKVNVRYGFEINSNSSFDFTSILYMASDDGTEPVAVGASRPTGIKVQVERDPTMRSYEDIEGRAINKVLLEAQGKVRAGAVIEPRVREGYIYTLEGFEPALGIQGEVQYLWDGDRAYTSISINAPNARLPLGNSRLKGMTQTAFMSIQELIQ